MLTVHENTCMKFFVAPSNAKSHIYIKMYVYAVCICLPLTPLFYSILFIMTVPVRWASPGELCCQPAALVISGFMI